jgi:tRNA nucleotidyltransferase (CCA-adding enzyme)
VPLAVGGQGPGIEVPPFPIERDVLELLATLWSAGHGGYVVGGGVRDALLGLPVTDWDIATDARPERLLEVFPGSSYQNRFGTVLARGREVTTFRRDHHYADHRRPDMVTFSQDIFEDLARRDLTINAIAWGRRGLDAASRLLDPADGQGDLRAGLVRAVGDPDQRFDEDALRLLRAVRIAARLEFQIEPLTLAAMRRHAGDVSWVSEERIGTEIRRMLAGRAPLRAFTLMLATGILPVVLPEVAGLPAAARDLALRTIEAIPRDQGHREQLAFAALLADADEIDQVLERMRLPRREVEASVTLAEALRVPYRSSWRDADVRRYMSTVRSDLLDDALDLRAARAAATGSGSGSDLEHEQRLRERIEAQRAAGSSIRLADLAIDGRDLQDALGLSEGPIIGSLLERLLADVIEDPTLDSRSTLLARASLMLEHDRQGDSSRHSSARIR